REIRPPSFGSLSPGPSERDEIDRINQIRVYKLLLLLKHYKLIANADDFTRKVDDAEMWCKLSWLLATDLVRGMQIVKAPAKRGPRIRWTEERQSELDRDVELVQAENPRLTARQALRELPKRWPQRWSRLDQRSLETRYSEARRRQKTRAAGPGMLSEFLSK